VPKHVKLPFGASDRRPVWEVARARVGAAVTRRAGRYSLSAGGVGASLTAIATHQVSTAAIAAVGATVVAGFITKCVECRFQQERGVIEARGAADKDRILVDAKAQESKARSDIRLILVNKLLEDPSLAPIIGPQLARLDLLSLAEISGLKAEHAGEFGGLIVGVRPSEPPDRVSPPAGLAPIPPNRPTAMARRTRGFDRPNCRRAWRHTALGNGENPGHIF